MGDSNRIIIYVCLKNRDGLYKNLCNLREKMTYLKKNEFCFCFNSCYDDDDGPPSKTYLYIYMTVDEKDQVRVVKGFMEFINGCASLFKLPSKKQSTTWASVTSKSILVPYPNPSLINTTEVLEATKTPGFHIDINVCRSPSMS